MNIVVFRVTQDFSTHSFIRKVMHWPKVELYLFPRAPEPSLQTLKLTRSKQEQQVVVSQNNHEYHTKNIRSAKNTFKKSGQLSEKLNLILLSFCGKRYGRGFIISDHFGNWELAVTFYCWFLIICFKNFWGVGEA